MSSIRYDGSDTLRINGRRVPYQGMAALKTSVKTAQAVLATQGDGLQEYFLQSPDRQQRFAVWADKLDFSFEKQNSVPKITVDGQPMLMAAYNDAPTSVAAGFYHGAVEGFSTAARAILDFAKTSIGASGTVGVLTFAGGSGFALLRGFAVKDIVASAGGMTGTALEIIGGVLAIGALLMGGAGGIKGAMDAADAQKNLEPLADVTDPGTPAGPNPDPAAAGTLVVDPGATPASGIPPTPSPGLTLRRFRDARPRLSPAKVAVAVHELSLLHP